MNLIDQNLLCQVVIRNVDIAGDSRNGIRLSFPLVKTTLKISILAPIPTELTLLLLIIQIIFGKLCNLLHHVLSISPNNFLITIFVVN